MPKPMAWIRHNFLYMEKKTDLNLYFIVIL